MVAEAAFHLTRRGGATETRETMNRVFGLAAEIVAR